jgi:hypothetical protein
MLRTLASTGELLPLRPPAGLPNVTYTMDSVVPLIRCRASEKYIRTWTATTAYGAHLAEIDGSGVNSFVFHPQT